MDYSTPLLCDPEPSVNQPKRNENKSFKSVFSKGMRKVSKFFFTPYKRMVNSNDDTLNGDADIEVSQYRDLDTLRDRVNLVSTMKDACNRRPQFSNFTQSTGRFWYAKRLTGRNCVEVLTRIDEDSSKIDIIVEKLI